MLNQHNEVFKEIIRNSSDLILILDSKLNLVYTNSSLKRILGYNSKDVIGSNLLSFIHPEDISKIQNRFNTGLDKPGIKEPIEARARHKDGHWIYFESSYNNMLNVPDINGIIVVARDIMKRKKIENILRQSEGKMKGIFDAVLDGIIVTDIKGNILQVNDSLLKIYGYETKEEILGQNVFNFSTRGTHNTAIQIRKHALNKGYIKEIEYPSKRTDGTEIPVELNVSIMKDDSGNPTGFVTVIKDLSIRKKTEEKLKESEERLKNAFDSAAEGIALLDNHGKLLEVNDKVVKFLGSTREKIIGNSLADIMKTLKIDSTAVLSTFESIVQGKEVGERELTFLNPKGEKIVLRPHHSFIKKNGKIIGLFYMLEDITKRKQTEESLKEAEERFKTLFDNVKDGIVVARAEDKMFYTGNQMICRMLGYTLGEFSKLGVKNIHPEESLPYVFGEFEKLARGEITKTIDVPVKRKNGSVFYADINCSSIIINKKAYLVSIFTDVTERKKIEDLQRLMVLGQMASGIAHEMRNPLGAIKNASYFLNMEMKNPKPGVKEALDILHKEVANSERIIKGLLFFASPKKSVHHKIEINKTIKYALSLMKIPDNIKVLKKLSEKLPLIPADSNQLVQVFENIILNSVQAMPKGGTLIVKSATKKPNFITISFTDKGIGITEGNLYKIFDPFFTTKARGIGLGLSVSKILIEQHNGTIEVKSKKGKGSSFIIKLPVYKK